ncbi:MAG: hypothetical protein ABIA75_07930 [Candidatus Neomarinimicrobiota bacterium]
MNKKLQFSNPFRFYRNLWYLVGEQPAWSQLIWKILLVFVPIFILADLLLVIYVIVLVFMRIGGVTPPSFW